MAATLPADSSPTAAKNMIKTSGSGQPRSARKPWADTLFALLARASALLTLDFQPLAAPTLYGRELLHVRNDPWLLMAALQASGHVPQEEELVREREAQLCQSPQCPYAGRAPCEQPFCLAQRTVLPSTPATPAGAA